MSEERTPIEVSRRIGAAAAPIFEVLANPQRHMEFDGSNMLRGAVLDRPISQVGDTFTMKMNRLGDDYLMLNYVVEFEPGRRILSPDGDDATVVTEAFDCGTVTEEVRRSLLSDGAKWINGHNTMVESMVASLERLEKLITK
jgi:hypothetical protein